MLTGEIRVPAGDGAESFVDLDDVADVVATILADPDHSTGDYELTGPQPLTFFDVANELSRVTRSTITYTPVSHDQYFYEQTQKNSSRDWIDLSATLYETIASGALETTTHHIETITGRPARPFHLFATKAEASGAWRKPHPKESKE